MISIGLTTPNERSWGKVLQTAGAAGMEAEGGASEGFTLLQELKRVVRKSNMVMSFHDFGNLESCVRAFGLWWVCCVSFGHLLLPNETQGVLILGVSFQC